MGIFHETIELVNRTSQPLEVIYDGQRTILEPNYTDEGKRQADVHNVLPKIVIPVCAEPERHHGQRRCD
jgi:hypothetical protein